MAFRDWIRDPRTVDRARPRFEVAEAEPRVANSSVLRETIAGSSSTEATPADYV